MDYYNKHKSNIKIKLQNPIDFVNYFGKYIKSESTENLIVIILNDRFELNEYQIFKGNKDSTVNFDAREIYEMARRTGSSFIVLMHNHPTGDPRPSNADIINTRILYERLMSFRVEISDHIIVSQNAYFSFDRNHVLDEAREFCGRISAPPTDNN